MNISKITEVVSRILFFLMMPSVMPISASRIRVIPKTIMTPPKDDAINW